MTEKEPTDRQKRGLKNDKTVKGNSENDKDEKEEEENRKMSVGKDLQSDSGSKLSPSC